MKSCHPLRQQNPAKSGVGSGLAEMIVIKNSFLKKNNHQMPKEKLENMNIETQ